MSHIGSIARYIGCMISSTDLAAMSGDDLVEAMRVRAVHRREIDAECAQLAGEIAKRSAPELGYSGLAQQTGARTPQMLVQPTTGLSKAEAGALVRVGTQAGVTWHRSIRAGSG